MTSNAKEPFLKSHFCIGSLIFIFTYGLLLTRLNEIRSPYFDEYIYISAAKQFLTQGKNENWSHPPLGKLLISLGIYLFGDEPLGWRFLSVFFGSVTLVSMYFLGVFLMKKKSSAIQVVLLCLLNQVFFVQSRTATLEGPLFGLISVALALFLFYWLKNGSIIHLYASTLFFGLAAAVKWFAIVPLLICLALLFIDEKPSRDHLKKRAKILFPILALCLISYFGPFLLFLKMKHPEYAPAIPSSSSPSPKYGLRDLITIQKDMLRAQMDFHFENHPNQSDWYSWPMTRKILWYKFPWNVGNIKENKQGLAFFGNPVIMWFGVAAMILCVWISIKKRYKEAVFISILYFGMYLAWSVIPRKTEFYYYYYPSAMFLSLGLVYVSDYYQVNRILKSILLVLAVIVFVIAFPLLSNTPLASSDFDYRVHLLTLGGSS